MKLKCSTRTWNFKAKESELLHAFAPRILSICHRCENSAISMWIIKFHHSENFPRCFQEIVFYLRDRDRLRFLKCILYDPQSYEGEGRYGWYMFYNITKCINFCYNFTFETKNCVTAFYEDKRIIRKFNKRKIFSPEKPYIKWENIWFSVSFFLSLWEEIFVFLGREQKCDVTYQWSKIVKLVQDLSFIV